MRIDVMTLLLALQVSVVGCSGPISSVNTRSGSSSHPGSSNPPVVPNSTGPVSIFPASETLRIGGQRQFSGWDATVGQYDVTWSLEEGAAAGSITTNGLYTAPSTPGTFHLVATSSHSPNLSASALLTIESEGFVPVGNMGTARLGHTATLLSNGGVLVVGGNGGAIPTAEVFVPGSSSFVPTSGAMVYARSGHCASILRNGWVLIVGGGDGQGGFFKTAELFDPVTRSFSATGDLSHERTGATATLLPSGKVLIAGGQDSSGALLSSAELYDLGTGTFTLTGNMQFRRAQHTATLLPSGKVLLLGSVTETADAELFDPGSGIFSTTGSLIQSRTHHTATLLPNGNVLVTGGTQIMPPGGGGAPSGPVSLHTTEIYDSVKGIFQAAGQLRTARDSHSAALLANGTVLVTGGYVHDFDGDAQSEWYTVFSAETFDPVTSAWSAAASLHADRAQHIATPLNDGEVLITGGISGQLAPCCHPHPYTVTLASAELYK
jgi:hypothetical protein